jgi:hypothetical protein
MTRESSAAARSTWAGAWPRSTLGWPASRGPAVVLPREGVHHVAFTIGDEFVGLELVSVDLIAKLALPAKGARVELASKEVDLAPAGVCGDEHDTVALALRPHDGGETCRCALP